MINSNYIWQVASIESVDANYDKLHNVILQLLRKRGIITSEQIHRYIYPKLDYLYNPMLLRDLDKAIVRIKEALAKKERITVYGDYDVDGITSCCIITKMLKVLGGVVDYYIPSRLHEGYGLSKAAIEKIHKQGISLIITVDNGMGSYEEVKYALDLGLDIVITDHHEPQHEVPHAVAIVNPKQGDCNYPFKELAGVGVALKLAHAMVDNNSELLQEFLELAAIGTVADIVPLLDENRIIVKNGLQLLGNTKNKGLSALMTLLNLDSSSIDTRKISFMLAPRLNAAGRIADPSIAVELLLCEDDIRAFELATTLEKINQDRQLLEAKVLEEAKTTVEQKVNLDKENIIIISSPNWHPGIIGTVASKLTEIYGRPCIIISEEGAEGRGSGRSIAGFNLFEALSMLSHHLTRFGGHEQAVGLGIKVENIELFKREVNELSKDKIDKIGWSPKLDIDLELNQKDINLNLAEQLELMKPYGYGNKKPVFMSKNMHIRNIRTVGNGDKHLKLSLKSREKNIDAIGFNFGLYKEDLDMALVMDVAFHLEVNRWRNSVGPQLNIKDLKIPFLQDQLLCDIEKNYYMHFSFSLCSYDYQISSNEKEELLKRKSSIAVFNDKSVREKREYVKSLFEKDRRVAVIINTPYKAWQLLTFLKNDDGLKNKSQISFGLDLPDNITKGNIIIINPLVEINNDNFDDIVFYDTPFNIDIFKKQLHNLSSNSKIYILFERGDLQYNYLVCQHISPSINELKAVYSILKNRISGSSACNININDLQTLLQERLEIDINYYALINVFKIFNEMGICEFNIKEDFINISINKKQNSIFKLEYSDTYMNLFMLKKKVIEFYNHYFNLQTLLGGY